jgi:hypothetical protein
VMGDAESVDVMPTTKHTKTAALRNLSTRIVFLQGLFSLNKD